MADDTPSLTQEQQILQTALSLPVPRVYINGFQIAQSMSDVMIVAQTNGAPCAIFNMSFTTTKSLAVELNKLIQRFEAETQHAIMTIEDVQTRQMANVSARQK